MMYIVINISDNDYRKVQDGRASVSMMLKAIRNGTPLPKGHGRMIDADQLEKEIEDYSKGAFAMTPEFLVKDAPTIIEADKEYEAKVITRGKCMMCGKELTEGLFFCKECGDKANSRK